MYFKVQDGKSISRFSLIFILRRSSFEVGAFFSFLLVLILSIGNNIVSKSFDAFEFKNFTKNNLQQIQIESNQALSVLLWTH